MLLPLTQLVLLLAGGSLVGVEYTVKEAAVAVSELQQSWSAVLLSNCCICVL